MNLVELKYIASIECLPMNQELAGIPYLVVPHIFEPPDNLKSMKDIIPEVLKHVTPELIGYTMQLNGYDCNFNITINRRGDLVSTYKRSVVADSGASSLYEHEEKLEWKVVFHRVWVPVCNPS